MLDRSTALALALHRDSGTHRQTETLKTPHKQTTYVLPPSHKDYSYRTCRENQCTYEITKITPSPIHPSGSEWESSRWPSGRFRVDNHRKLRLQLFQEKNWTLGLRSLWTEGVRTAGWVGSRVVASNGRSSACSQVIAIFLRGNSYFHYLDNAESSAITNWIHKGIELRIGSASQEQRLPRVASSCAALLPVHDLRWICHEMKFKDRRLCNLEWMNEWIYINRFVRIRQATKVGASVQSRLPFGLLVLGTRLVHRISLTSKPRKTGQVQRRSSISIRPFRVSEWGLS
jgi:hypothetical protein